MKMGLVGLGKMGTAIAARLRDTGHEVVGWDAAAPAREAAAATGLRIVDAPRAVAEAADTVISIITEDDGVRRIFLEAGGFLEADIGGKLFIEMSTLRPATLRDLAPRVDARRGRIVDAPVLGTVPAARSGQLMALVGGSTEDFTRAEAALAPLARACVHMGATGHGAAMKLVANLVMAAYVEALAEGLAMGDREGLALDGMLAVLAESVLANGWLKAKLPMLAGKGGDLSLDVRTLRKDVTSALATGSAAGVPMPAAAGILATLSAAVATGDGGADLADVPRILREKLVQTF